MITNRQLFIETLHQNGYSATKARLEVYKVLREFRAVTVREIVDKTHANRASVYRSIELFEKLSIAHRVYTGWKYKIELSELFDPHHHHATCSKCGTVLSLPEDPKLEAAIQSLSSEYGFLLSSHQVELSGVCKICQS